MLRWHRLMVRCEIHWKVCQRVRIGALIGFDSAGCCLDVAVQLTPSIINISYNKLVYRHKNTYTYVYIEVSGGHIRNPSFLFFLFCFSSLELRNVIAFSVQILIFFGLHNKNPGTRLQIWSKATYSFIFKKGAASQRWPWPLSNISWLLPASPDVSFPFWPVRFLLHYLML